MIIKTSVRSQYTRTLDTIIIFDHTAYLDVRELAQVSIHGDESMVDQLLVVVSPQHITVLQHGWT